MQHDEAEKRINTYLTQEKELLHASFSGKQRGKISPWKKVDLRPVSIRGQHIIQFSYYDERKCIVKNYTGEEYFFHIKELLSLPFKSIYIQRTDKTLQVQFSKKGRPLTNESKTISTQVKATSHNRKKQYILPEGVPNPFLYLVGIMDNEGNVKSIKFDKFRQINNFLKVIDETIQESKDLILKRKSPLLGIDCGCGNAYLTFASYFYFNSIINTPLKLIGIDTNKELLYAHETKIKELGWQDLSFETSSIIRFKTDATPDIVFSLHACDTATDETLAQAIQWNSLFIFSSPCCHHHLQTQLAKNVTPSPFTSVFRYGVLKERLGDILTDTFRSLILRIMGYKTEIIEFTSLEHTNKNLLIRAVQSVPQGDTKFIKEYNKLKEYWKVTPYLETLLGESFQKVLAST